MDGLVHVRAHCILAYPACKAHASYFIGIFGVSGSTSFLTLSHKQQDFLKKITVLVFL
jgi:hypothetical protein